ncbi:MAG: metalloregulator ArsR/SmtB family transcription factor [candidate division NC10 bacterium]|nr:metalloregulator ArsR/SmtB family transcription factor [candidate division NC10 bacterium]
MSTLTKRLPAQELEQLQLEAKFFRGLGDPTRLKILELLLQRERTVTELVKTLGVPQGRVSSHLACLSWCGYVTAFRQGRNRHYRVADRRVRKILELARDMVSDNAKHIWACTRIERDR